MTHHIHLLSTPHEEDSVSQIMQALGRQYVRYFNHSYKRTGTWWKGYFKSCLLEGKAYLPHLYRNRNRNRYELNPVRTSMVAQPSEYVWSKPKLLQLAGFIST